MYFVFNLEEWKWPEIQTFMKKNGGIPCPLAYPNNGWLKLRKGFILWDNERNGCALDHFKKKDLYQILKWAKLAEKGG